MSQIAYDARIAKLLEQRESASNTVVNMAGELSVAKAQIGQLISERDAALASNADLTAKLADATAPASKPSKTTTRRKVASNV